MNATTSRARSFCHRFGVRAPILLAPMADACPPFLSITVANAGGLGACGTLLMQPAEILGWVEEVRAYSPGAFQLNLWIPGPAPTRDAENEAAIRAFLAGWGPPLAPQAADAGPLDFARQFDALLEAALKEGDVRRMQAWAGQLTALAKAAPAARVLHHAWDGAQALLGSPSPQP